jgi:multisubunit Na+/H+ antiporter MnhF subunit
MDLLDTTLLVVASGALIIHTIFLLMAVLRAWRGENSFDRLIGLDLTGTLILCILVLVAVVGTVSDYNMNVNNAIFIDVALGLAALSYLITIALAKYIVDHRMF